MRQSRKTWMLPKDEPIMEATSGGLSTALWMVVGAAAIFVALVLIVPSLPTGPLPSAQPAATAAKPAATPLRTPPTVGTSGEAPRPPSLPDCATVTDSRTACTGTGGEMPQGQAEGEPQPTGTPEPRWVTETCLTPPGARPCWLPADQPWQPLVSVPETPIVLVAEPPIVDVCAMWHAPLPWPEGCPIGEDE